MEGFERESPDGVIPLGGITMSPSLKNFHGQRHGWYPENFEHYLDIIIIILMHMMVVKANRLKVHIGGHSPVLAQHLLDVAIIPRIQD